MLARVRSGESAGINMNSLGGDLTSRSLEVTFEAPDVEAVPTRWHLGCWLIKTFGDFSSVLDAGAWSWLALHLFDIVCPREKGTRKLRENARYLLEENDYRKAHRHLLAGPFLLLQAHHYDKESVRGLLATAPDAPGEVYEQLAARKYTVASPAVARVATQLYFNKSTSKLKKGAGGSAGGSPRRLSEVLQQFDMTYDLQAISAHQLLRILPKEFDRFR